MGDAVVGGEEGRREDFAGVDASEDAGFGGGVEELAESVAMDGEVVDGFVGDGGFAGSVGGLREHGHDGSRVGICERFILGEVSVLTVMEW